MRGGEGRVDEIFGKSVEVLDMSVRTANALARLNVNTIGDLVHNCTARGLRAAVEDPANADRVIGEVRGILAEIGFTLKEGDDESHIDVGQEASESRLDEVSDKPVEDLKYQCVLRMRWSIWALALSVISYKSARQVVCARELITPIRQIWWLMRCVTYFENLA